MAILYRKNIEKICFKLKNYAWPRVQGKYTDITTDFFFFMYVLNIEINVLLQQKIMLGHTHFGWEQETKAKVHKLTYENR